MYTHCLYAWTSVCVCVRVCAYVCLYLFLLVIALFVPLLVFCIIYVGQRMTNFLQISAPGQKSRTQICFRWIYVVTTNNTNPVPFIMLMSNKSQDTHTHWEYSSEMK
jgi:hypothetical protein